MSEQTAHSKFELRPARLVSFETVLLNRQGEPVQRLAGQSRQAVQELGGGILLELVEIPKGSFQMGSHHEGGYEDERPRHIVFLDSFWLGKFPVTQAQWQIVMASQPPTGCRFHGPDLPVDTICWKDARSFCERLSRRTGQHYGLPSEAQWEYACRAGTGTPFSFGETITTDYVNYVGDHTYREEPAGLYRHGTTPVGAFPPNPWGLCDMHGNVWEFCGDAWTADYTGAPGGGNSHLSRAQNTPLPSRLRFGSWFADPAELIPLAADERSQPAAPGFRVARGGSWHETPGHCRSAMRLRVKEDERMEFYGMRVMLR